MENLNQPFNSLLPHAMVGELLEKGEELSNNLLTSLENINQKRDEYRQNLESKGILLRDSDLPAVMPPTTCGVDGANIVERLLAVDIIACCAVAIEGLTPPSEKRYWEDVRHRTFIHNEIHNDSTSIVVSGIMWQLELDLAANAPHDIVFVDGSLTNPIIKMNAAVNKAEQNFMQDKLGKQISDNFQDFLKNYKTVVNSTRSDKFWIGMPKYTSKKEISELMNWETNYDDRSLLTALLKSGEYTKPIPYKQPKDDKGGQDWHLKFPSSSSNNSSCQQLWNEIKNGIHRLHVVYYKPHNYTPVLRIEVPSSVKDNKSQLRMILDAIKYQCPTPSIIEPYPLYMADTIVKEVSKAVPALRQVAIRKMAKEYTGDLSEVFFSMHSYRTENTK